MMIRRSLWTSQCVLLLVIVIFLSIYPSIVHAEEVASSRFQYRIDRLEEEIDDNTRPVENIDPTLFNQDISEQLKEVTQREEEEKVEQIYSLFTLALPEGEDQTHSFFINDEFFEGSFDRSVRSLDDASPHGSPRYMGLVFISIILIGGILSYKVRKI